MNLGLWLQGKQVHLVKEFPLLRVTSLFVSVKGGAVRLQVIQRRQR